MPSVQFGRCAYMLTSAKRYAPWCFSFNPSRNMELYLKLCHTDNTNTVTCHDDAQVICRDEQRVGNVTVLFLIRHVLYSTECAILLIWKM